MGRRVAAPALSSLVAQRRIEAGLSQVALAERVGLARQAIGAIEAGRYVPNTVVALRLAQVLGCRVEDLFALPEATDSCVVDVVDRSPALQTKRGADDAPDTRAHRLSVVKVRDRWLGYPLQAEQALHDGFAVADALAPLVQGRPGRVKKAQANLLAPRDSLERTALLLGCDPSLGILSAHVTRRDAGARLLWRSAASQAALGALERGEAHIAGSHLHDPVTGTHNLPHARRALAGTGGIVVAFAHWEQGFVVAPGNPKGVRSIEDLARPDVRLVNRESGAGSRALLDNLLERAGIPASSVNGYEREVTSHRAAAAVVASGGADVAVALRATALALGLAFVPLAEARFDLVIPRDHLEHPTVATLLDVLQNRSLREELRALPGYEVDAIGSVRETVPAA